MSNVYEHLGWLPSPPSDFSARLSTAILGRELRELAQYSLDDNHLRKLSKTLHALRQNRADLAPLVPMKIGIISNATTKLHTPALIGTALRFGIALEVFEAEYNQVAQVSFSSEPPFSGQTLNALLIAIDYRGLPLSVTPGDHAEAERGLQECTNYLHSIVDALHNKTGAQIILQNIAPPPENLFGSFEARLPGTLAWTIRRLNESLNGMMSDSVIILDVAGLAANVGLANWHDPTMWNMAKLPFAPRFTPIYTDFVCRVLGAKIGKSRRCLVVDLDNTLWGGVIGDDGLEGIVLGNGDPTGEAHLHLQHTISALHNRGVVLAVSSKNEDVIARQPFREHPEMHLKEGHIAVFQANWSDKAANIKAISETLSLGLESIVFLDDNPAERAQVRRELPEVAVPELPTDPALFARTLVAAGYFEAIGFSDEDRRRASFYQDNAKRAIILKQSSDMDSYLKSLGMEISLRPFDLTGRSRIAQLISKSNQYNLTTKRYSELDIKHFEDDPRYFTRQVRLTDVLGDNGMISVVICEIAADVWHVDSWLMSCRVLGRRVEEAVLRDMVINAQAAGAKKIVGQYIPTSRNMIARSHYQKLGFTKTPVDSAAGETWELAIENYVFVDIPIAFQNAI